MGRAQIRGNSKHGERRLAERRRLQRRGEDGGRSLTDLPWGTSAQILGYRIEAADGVVGLVADFCVEEESLTITEIVARLLPGRERILVPLSAIERIDWPKRKVYLRPTRREIKQWSRNTAAIRQR